MGALTWADQRRIAEFARELYCLNSVKGIAERVVQRVGNLIGCNSAWIFDEGKTDAPHLLAENVGPEWQKLLPTALTLRHEHPGIRYHHVYRGRAVAIADLLPLYQWKRTALYNDRQRFNFVLTSRKITLKPFSPRKSLLAVAFR